MFFQNLADVLAGIKNSWAKVLISWFYSYPLVSFQFFQSFNLKGCKVCTFFIFMF